MLPSNLRRVSDGYEDIRSGIRFRISSRVQDPVLAAWKDWTLCSDMNQTYLAQCDEIWRTHCKEMSAAKTGLTAYLRFQAIPKSAVRYKDLCRNTVAHRLVYTFRGAPAALVSEFWDFAFADIESLLQKKNAFGHTPWEMMAMFPDAWDGVLRDNAKDIHRYIPVGSWRNTSAFHAAYATLRAQQKHQVLAHLKPRQIDLLCALTRDDCELFATCLRHTPDFLGAFTPALQQLYPGHADCVVQCAVDSGRSDVVHKLLGE